MRALPSGAGPVESAIQLRAQGTATAEGLQQARQLGMLSQLARSATGSTPYTLALAFRRGVPEILVATNLQGLGLALPAPLAKTADALLPVRFETRVAQESLAAVPAGAAPPPLRDQMTLDLGSLGSASFQREHQGNQTRVLRGAIGIGLGVGEVAPMPVDGVAANIRAEQMDVDAWEKVLTQAAIAEAALPPPPSLSGQTARRRAWRKTICPPPLPCVPRRSPCRGAHCTTLWWGARATVPPGVPTWTPANSMAMSNTGRQVPATTRRAVCLPVWRA